jgi:two-component system cell cycle sensor histidine kinase/response regulator CckA
MHNLLKRQIKRHFNNYSIPEELKAFLQDVDNAYIQSDTDRLMLERSLELTSQELLQANQEIRESEERVRTLMNAMPDIVCLKDGEGRWLEANDFNLKLLQLQGVSYHGKKDSELADFSTFYRNIFLSNEKSDERVWQAKVITRGEVTIPRPNGTNLVFDIIKVPLFYPDGRRKGLVLIGRDITDRKTAEEALNREMHFTKTIIEASPAFFVAIEADGRIILMNKSMLTALGYAEDDVIGKDYLTDFVPNDEREMLNKIFDQLVIKKEATLNENHVLTKDGRTLLVEWHSMPVINDKSEFEYFFGVGIDITERKKLESQLIQARKMEAVGTLAGGIAHNFNNLLTVMQGYISLMLMDFDEKHMNNKYLKNIEEQIQSGARLTRQLLGFARSGKYEVRPINLNDIIEKTAILFGHTKKEVIIQKKFEKDLWIVEIDQGQIEQSLLNLFVNAWQAMPGGGTLNLETGNILLQESFTRVHYCKPGKYVKVSVADTGVGIDEEKKERIFDPFFTTKELGHGTGLGLASVYGIIKSHGGIIDVYSSKGHGSTFNIYLPASGKQMESLSPIPERIQLGEGTILLVDDEEVVIDVCVKLLYALGYKAHVAKSGKEAVEIYKLKKDEIDLVILDIIMPGQGGVEVYYALKEIKSDVKILLSSGYTIDENTRELMDHGCRGFIQKPYTIHELSNKILDVLKTQ